MKILEATIHRLIKSVNTTGQNSVVIQLRTKVLPIDQTLTTVVTDLIGLYAKSADSQGTFGDNSSVHIFPQRFDDYLDKKLPFKKMTEDAVDLIGAAMQGASFASGGYALFVRYEFQSSDFFLIAMLKLRPGAGIDEKTLDLEPTLNIDLDRLNEAARVNVTRLRTGVEPYLTFIKGRRAKSQVTDYFRSALSCTSFTSSAHHTLQLMQAADAYVEQRSDLDDEAKQGERIAMRQRLFDYFKSSPEEVTLQTAAAHVHPNDGDEFLDFVKGDGEQQAFSMDDAFRPDKRTYRRLQRIAGTIGSVRLSFDVQDVQDGTVSYDPGLNAVIIKGPTDVLKQEILNNEHPAP